MVASPKEERSNDQTKKIQTGPSVHDRADSARRGPPGRHRQGLPAPGDGNWEAEVIEGHAAIKSAVAALIKNLRIEYDLEQAD
jgi:hypothetical protein